MNFSRCGSRILRSCAAAAVGAALLATGGCALWNDVAQPDNLVYGMDTTVTKLQAASKESERFLIHRDGNLIVVEIGPDGKIKHLDQSELIRIAAPKVATAAGGNAAK